ncbi:tumor necrosis factor receptor superfamily member 11A [Trichomycterus rosablanca]|uniref:tumor necrosis factor receptor superfamily member 11A n=1 Tax=Trichomycterus rosablanca TaxID=2290929 RepID=UPI002F35F8F0
MTKKTCSPDHCLHGERCCKLCPKEHKQRELKQCEAHSDRRCGCDKGYYSETSHALHCKKVTNCPPGHGVSVLPTGTSDIVCTKCPPGTFNNVSDFTTPCRNHNRCEVLGRYLVAPGTAETDAVCGNFTTPPPCTGTDDYGSCPTGCHWMIPTSLWACLILTIILAAGICYCRSKRRRKTAVITSVDEEIFNLPVLPPDILKYPRSPEPHTTTHKDEFCSDGDGHLQCDGVESLMILQNFSHFSGPETFLTSPSIIKSEPEEDEWPGA